MKKRLSIALSLIMVLSLTACSFGTKTEVYEATADGFGGPVSVKVTFAGEDITEVEVTGDSETQGIGTNAIEQLPAAIVEADSADVVDAITGATVSYNAIIALVADAAAQAGADVEALKQVEVAKEEVKDVTYNVDVVVVV